MNNNGEMKVTISGNKLPMVAIIVGFAAVISFTVAGVVWLTKLDDRVYDNSRDISKNATQQVEHAKIMSTLQQNCSKQTAVLDSLIKQVDNIQYNNNKYIDTRGK